MDGLFAQEGHGVRFEWGPQGANRLAARVACLVIVDVLSFTTSVTVAVERGTRVYPCGWDGESAAALADEVGADLAVGRRGVTEESPWSLSPTALRRAPFTPRLVLPSPNGSAVTVAVADSSAVVLAGSLRNAEAVGEWLAVGGWGTGSRPVGVIAAGERWSCGGLRPALEDLLGAGAVIAALSERSSVEPSPEAVAAAAACTATRDVGAVIADCTSGRELTALGFGDDVAVATDLNVCGVVPVLHGGRFFRGG